MIMNKIKTIIKNLFIKKSLKIKGINPKHLRELVKAQKILEEINREV